MKPEIIVAAIWGVTVIATAAVAYAAILEVVARNHSLRDEKDDMVKLRDKVSSLEDKLAILVAKFGIK